MKYVHNGSFSKPACFGMPGIIFRVKAIKLDTNVGLKAADDDAGKLQPVFLKRLYLLHICIFSFFLFNASLTTI